MSKLYSLRKLFENEFEGHRGRPGKVGGSLPRGSSVSVSTKHTGKDAIRSKLELERNELMEMDSSGQQSRLREGVTRQMVKEYYRRVELYKTANSKQYNSGFYGGNKLIGTIADQIDRNIANGYVIPYRHGKSWYLESAHAEFSERLGKAITKRISYPTSRDANAYFELLDYYNPGFLQDYDPIEYPPNNKKYNLADWQG